MSSARIVYEKFIADVSKHMAARIPISWLVALAILGVFAFFTYHILQVRSTDSSVTESFPAAAAKSVTFAEETESPDYLTHVPDATEMDTGAPVTPKMRPVAHRMPHVPGQTEYDLRESEPLQASPPAVQYDIPESTDPLVPRVHMDAEFGSNLRHPEQMIEMRPHSGMGNVISSGLGSQLGLSEGNYAGGYEPEMIQNGGEFMAGISAFDMGGSGAYAAI
jgi:hypothetical protein